MTHLTKKPTFVLSAISALLLSSPNVVLADQITSYTYNALGLIETVDGPRLDVSDITTFTYDASANLTHVTNALGHVAQITSHDLSGRPLTLLDANGAMTTLVYDVRGRLLSQDVAGNLTQYSYDATGNVDTITLANGEVITYHYDSAHRNIGYSDALGSKVTYTLDAAGNILTQDITDSSQLLTQTHQYVYDELSRLRSDIGADNQTANFDYDVNNNLTDQVDPNTNPTNFAFDALDRLIDTTDADLGHTSYTYDDRDNLTTVTDANSNTTIYSYDTFDNLISQDSPDTGTTTYTYDEAGNRLTQTDARGVTTTYTYDALNRLLTVSYPDASQNITYTYDENGNSQNGIGRLTSQTDATGTTSYTYDLRGNVLSMTRTLGGNSYTTSYAYNTADQLTQISYPDGRTLDYQYDLAGRLSQVDTTDSQSNSQTLLSNISYQPFGPLKDQTYGNGLTMIQASDLDYRQTSLTTTNVLERGYGFDANSNITSITDNVTADSQTFVYDNLNRLDNADDSSVLYGDIDYQYDPVHNRTAKNTVINSLTDNESYQYQTDSNILASKTAGSTINYQYDANGNMTDNGTYEFTYGDNNRIETVSQSGNVIATYAYNAQGQRTQKVTTTDTTYYLYGLQGELMAEANAAGNLTKSYLFANGQLLAMNQAGTAGEPLPPVEVVLDNGDASFSGLWTHSTAIAGYQGDNYQVHAGNAAAGPGEVGTPIDNTQATYSDSWTTSTSIKQYYGANYQVHAGSSASGPGTLGGPIDNLQATFTGTWSNSTSVKQFLDSNYQYHAGGSGANTATWTPSITTPASYDVYVTWAAHNNRASDAKYTINHAAGSDTITVNQQQNGGQWNLLGTYTLDELSNITLSDDANGYVIADGVTILPAGTSPVVTVPDETATWALNADTTQSYDVYATWTAHSNRASDAKYTINHTAGSETVTVNQKQNGEQWNLLGTYTLDSTSTVELSSLANGYVIADGVTILPAGTTPAPTFQQETAIWTPNEVGEYEVYANWTAHPNRATDATYSINHATGSDAVSVNQQQLGDNWNLLGAYILDANSTISLSSEADGYVIADGIKLVSTTTVTPPQEAGLYYVHNDHLGTPQSLTSQNQDIVWQVTYTPFGQATILTQTVENNIRFPGQYYDQETQLHYNYYRYYDPSLGRYITSDPIGLAGGINTFGYVGGNPLGYSDPYGLLERCARGLGDKNKPAMTPSGTPLRHDFLVIDGDVYSFQAGDNMLWSDGFIDDDEFTDNEMCETVNDDKEFDEAAKQAIVEIGSPNYNVYAYPFTTPHMLGARNCQTWADDVINRTTEILEAKKAKK